MLTSVIVRIIDFCMRRAWGVVIVALLMAVAASAYTATHFAINSDIGSLSPDRRLAPTRGRV